VTLARSILVPALALLALAGVARAQQAPPGPRAQEDALAHLLFPPELVMQHQQEIGLRPEQRSAITKAIQELQTKVIDLQWKMQDQSQRLATLLQKPVVDQTAALTQLDEVLGTERDVKRAHITLLIQIKNTLTADQQAKLAAARGSAPPS
jgi:Spy/CpxP family protein refolding chaperone